MRALKALTAAFLVAIATPALSKDFAVGDKLYSGLSEMLMLVACHPSEHAFTLGGTATGGFTAVAWTFKVRVGDTFIINTSSSRKPLLMLKSMDGCTGSFEDVTAKQVAR